MISRYPTAFWIERLFKRKLHDSINSVDKLAQRNCFKLSTSKTSMLQIGELSIPLPVELRLGNIRIQTSET